MEERVRVKDRSFMPMIPRERIAEAVGEIAGRISADYAGKVPLFLCVLNGSFVFAADLLRMISVPCRVSFVKYASYSGTQSSQYVRNLIGLNEETEGTDVIIVEDIIDTGLTVSHLLKELSEKRVSSVRVAALFFKKEAFRGEFTVDYAGIEVPDEFIVGYGLDYDGYGRNLDGVYKIVNE